MEVKTEIAHTGIIGILHGEKLRPVAALRADMDAKPATESLELPFASNVKTINNLEPEIK